MRRLPRATFSRGFYEPRPNSFVIALLRHIGRLYLRFGQGTRALCIYNPRPLYEAFRAFYEGRSRLLVLFRHVEVADGPVVMTALTRDLWKLTKSRRRRRNLGIEGPRLPRKPHAFFLYGKDVLNWAGAGARWAFPRLGGIPVVNTRLDRASHETIRTAISRGEHPLALAPEGQVTYQMFRVSEPAAGVGTMARWIEEDLISEPQEIVVLPIAVGYHLAEDHDRLARGALKRFYRQLGEAPPAPQASVEELLHATRLLCDWLEEAYARAYPGAGDGSSEGPGDSQDIPGLTRRLERLCDRILRVCELGSGSGDSSPIRRLFASRYRATDLLYREGTDPKGMSPISRAWADFRALDALTMERHSQIVDVLMYLRPAYLVGDPGPHRRAEYALNILDVANRISGGNIDSRFSPSGKRARLLVGSPIDAGKLLRHPGRSPKEAAGMLNQRVYNDLVELSRSLEERMGAEIGL